MKQIKESHGSVALTTLVQVKAINSCGVFYIADSEKAPESKSMDRGMELCLQNLVHLVVPKEENENREEKVYSLEEIKDVQSKLMLIAGKADNGKEEVDQFNQVCYNNLACTEHFYNTLIWFVRSTYVSMLNMIQLAFSKFFQRQFCLLHGKC